MRPSASVGGNASIRPGAGLPSRSGGARAFSRGGGGAVPVAGELYELPDDVGERVHAGEPPNLYRGPVELEDGRVVPGILYPRELAEGHHREISEYGDWRVYWAARQAELAGE